MDFLLYFISYPVYLIKYLLLSFAGLLALVFTMHIIDKKASRYSGDQDQEEQK